MTAEILYSLVVVQIQCFCHSMLNSSDTLLVIDVLSIWLCVAPAFLSISFLTFIAEFSFPSSSLLCTSISLLVMFFLTRSVYTGSVELSCNKRIWACIKMDVLSIWLTVASALLSISFLRCVAKFSFPSSSLISTGISLLALRAKKLWPNLGFHK